MSSQVHRDTLMKSVQIPIASDNFPLERYYNFLSEILEEYLKFFEAGNWDYAYIFGKRYVGVATTTIPEHGYYNSNRFSGNKTESLRISKKILEQLGDVVQHLDVQEQRKKAENIRRQAKLDEEMRRLESEKKERERLRPKPSAPLMLDPDYYEGFDDFDLPVGGEVEKNIGPPSYDEVNAPHAPLPLSLSVSDLTVIEKPPPQLPPPPPLYPSLLDVPSNPSVRPTTNIPLPKQKWSPPIRELSSSFTKQWNDSLTSKKSAIYPLETHQGKKSLRGLDSTNGCTVIAPLIASAHIRSVGGVSDDKIEGIIDVDSLPLLSEIRRKLGLGHTALIVPSDVHDHMFDEKIISPETFIAVNGGNILDSEHVDNIVTSMNENGKLKSACALFFHAHVVCITKLYIPSNDETWFDIIDSLPRTHQSQNVKNTGVRIRCKSQETLVNCIKWYACEKFGAQDREFIDRNGWDEEKCDFDPRVFQCFTWGEVGEKEKEEEKSGGGGDEGRKEG